MGTMPSDAPVAARHACFEIVTTRCLEFVDLTDRLEAFVKATGVDAGLVAVQTRHTTTGLIVNEAEPLLLQDLAQRFARWAPAGEAYSHDDLTRRTVNVGPNERANGFAHCRAALLRTTETVLVIDGRLGLGRWQRLLLAEFDGPQRREVAALVIPDR